MTFVMWHGFKSLVSRNVVSKLGCVAERLFMTTGYVIGERGNDQRVTESYAGVILLSVSRMCRRHFVKKPLISSHRFRGESSSRLYREGLIRRVLKRGVIRLGVRVAYLSKCSILAWCNVSRLTDSNQITDDYRDTENCRPQTYMVAVS